MKTPPFPYELVKFFAGIATKFSYGEALAVGQSLPKNDWQFDGSSTQSKQRFDHYKDTFYDSRLTHMRRSGATYGFLDEVFTMTDKLLDPKQIKRVETPIMLFQAGLDSWVDVTAQNEFCTQSSVCRLVEFKGAKHEIYHEKDEFRVPYMLEILKTIDGLTQPN